jgi:hypothetical protein
VHELRQLEAASTAKGARVRCVLYDTAATAATTAFPSVSSPPPPPPPPAAAFSRLAAACLPCGASSAVAEHSNRNRVQPLPHRPYSVKAGRIDRIELQETLRALGGPVDGVPAAGPTTAFLCGPPKASCLPAPNREPNRVVK